jgi:hypothetical protein
VDPGSNTEAPEKVENRSGPIFEPEIRQFYSWDTRKKLKQNFGC